MKRVGAVAVVLGGEASASALLEKTRSGLLTVALIILSVAALVLVVEVIPDVLVKRTDRGARWFGKRLRSGRSVHGYWLTTITALPARDSRRRAQPQVLGGSVLHLKATREGFELEGETFMRDSGWTTWSGEGNSLEGNELVFRYGGADGDRPDFGIGRYAFDTAGSFQGSFHGSDVGSRAVRGKRCGPEASTKEWKNEVVRHQRLEAHLNEIFDSPVTRGASA